MTNATPLVLPTAVNMPETKYSKASLDKSAALKVRMEGYYQSLVQQAKERESR